MRLVLDAFRHYSHLAGAQHDRAVARGPATKMDMQFAIQHNEGLISIGMLMPDEFAFEPDYLELIVVHFRDHAGLPAALDQRDLAGEVDGLALPTRSRRVAGIRGYRHRSLRSKLGCFEIRRPPRSRIE